MQVVRENADKLLESLTAVLAEAAPKTTIPEVDKEYLLLLKQSLESKSEELNTRAQLLQSDYDAVGEALDKTESLLDDVENLLTDIAGLLEE